MARRPTIAAVFSREARRSSRRWQTYAMRTAAAASVMAMVLGAAATQVDYTDTAALSRMGYTLFNVYTGTQLAVVSVLAPLLVGLGIAEERDEGTLQLLVMTGLSARQIVWGKMVSRLMLLVALVLGGLPVLSIIASFGGVDLTSVLASTLNTLVVCLVLGTIGGVAALFRGGPAASLFSATVWAVACWGILPAIYGGLTTQGSAMPAAMSTVSPYPAAFATDWSAVWPALANLPVVVVLSSLITPLFSMVTSADGPDLDDPLGTDPAVHDAARAQRRVGILALAVPLWFIAAACAFYLTRTTTKVPLALYAFPPHLRAQVWHLVRADLAHGAALGSVVLAMPLFAALLALIQLRLSALIDAVIGGRSGRGGGLVSALRAVDAVIRPFRLPVWPLPALWRDVATRGGGGPVVSARWLAIPIFTMVLFGTCLGVTEEEGFLLVSGGMLWLFGMLLTAFVSTGTITADRTSRTLPLWLTTTASPFRYVLGKLASAIVHTLPYTAVGAVLLTLGQMTMSRANQYLWGGTACPVDALGPSLLWLNYLVIPAWMLSAWWVLVCASLLVAMRARPPRLAFGFVLAGGISLPSALIVALSALFNSSMAARFFPVFGFSTQQWVCGPSLVTLGLIALHGVVGLAALVVLVLRFRTWALRDAA